MKVERNDGARRAGVAVAVENDRRLLLAGIVTQQLAGNELVHGEVGLMEPEPAQGVCYPALLVELAGNLVTHQRQHLLEHLAPLLVKQLVIAVAGARAEPVQEAEVVANIVGVLVTSLLATSCQGLATLQSASRSSSTAVQASPKMK